MDVPGKLGATYGNVDCYYAKANVTADCAPKLSGSRAIQRIATPAGRYPPLFYAVVGWPSRWFPTTGGAYLMRLLAALVAAALLASAFLSALESRAAFLVPVGALAAITPMTLYLGASVNPNGIEIAAAVGVWMSLAALLLRSDGPNAGRLVARAGIASIVLVHMRGLSPLWLAMIVGIVVVAAPWSRVRAVLRMSATRFWIILVVVNALLAGLWIMLAGALDLAHSTAPAGGSVLRATIGKVDWNLHQMIGLFGPLDTNAPSFTYLAWFMAVGLLVLGAVAFGSRRGAIAVGVVTGLSIVVPIAIEAKQAHTFGLVWQGRYMLPVAVGVPIMAGFVLSEAWPQLARRAARPVMILSGWLALAGAVALYGTLRRYSVGGNGRLLFFLSPTWSPPVSVIIVLAAFFLGAAALAAMPVLLPRWSWTSALGPAVVDAGPALPDIDGGTDPATTEAGTLEASHR